MEKVIRHLTKDVIKVLKAGDFILFSGILYTARDQAHKKLLDLIKAKKPLPFDLKDKVIYYCGPTPALHGQVVGACGPTTSSRMDSFTPQLLSKGILAMIGKGQRCAEVIAAIKKYQAVYFSTYAGCGALLSQCVKSKKLICFAELGTEAVFAFEVEKFPLITAIDAQGGTIYE
ncbi:MAG: TRZ/ATZ family protein [Candidatus Omnitrophota bacterium]|nr:MAG: TRZ/ATZ family protein [Candidatus Omnitrophota bacterium]